ncbi:MAG: hypothetical protein COY66_00880 [Candidatus Kerfeldbacteria bacterium CG_4_10_14_0_8_um_filter_42_10]|uniref:Uncharacterized protein n=1 Tax=Candidatus Kerfeldbacteria bacterium CG_4_10_14_0_8_um_filter_42_10 TaxID=2014248 RepID=A0A2M7RKC1_9BACT|nr:MAG: hypothetical protein COY66_00880 [Candidatus Kerfeldbacteria bacterium CG_4_10_14_0_8_um_filter_42_10]
MLIEGTVKVEMHAICGWYEDWITIHYSVECEPNFPALKKAVEAKYGNMAYSYHDQSGCPYDCPCSTIFLWDTQNSEHA